MNEDMYHFPYIMAMHILANMQADLRKEAEIDPSCDAPLWCLCKKLCGDEHAQWIFEHEFPKEVFDHRLFGL